MDDTHLKTLVDRWLMQKDQLKRATTEVAALRKEIAESEQAMKLESQPKFPGID